MKKTTFIKIVQTLVLTLMLFTIVPSKPISAYTDNYIAYSLDSNGKAGPFYSSVDNALKDAREKGYTIVMRQDWEVNSAIDIVEGTSVTIEMNGHVIRRKGDGRLFVLHPNSTLTLLGNKQPNTTFDFKKNTNGITEGTVTSGGLLTNGYYDGDVHPNALIYMKDKATLNLTNVAVAGNKGKSAGAAIIIRGDYCTVNMNSAKVSYNDAAQGGAGVAVYGEQTNIYLENHSEFSYNKCRYKGAAVNFMGRYGSLISKDGTGVVTNNFAEQGSLAFMDEFNEVKNVTIENNTAYWGGGFYVQGSGGCRIEQCLIQNNKAICSGGGIYAAADVTLINSTIINNICNTDYYIYSDTNYDGGGIKLGDGDDLSLVGTIIIKDNKRVNGANSFTDDDVYLCNSDALIRANSLSSDSLIGLRTYTSSDCRMVKNLFNFEYGHVFFLDLADRFHLSYEANDKELWQRSGKTQYSVYVNGQEVGRYDYNQKVLVNFYNAVNDSTFVKWYSYEGLELTADQIKSSSLSFKMPARDVILKAELSYKQATSITVTADAPVVNKALNRSVSVNLMKDGAVYKTFTSNIMWQKKNADNSYSDLAAGYIAKEGETYRIRGGFTQDEGRLISYSAGITNDNVKIVYKAYDLEVSEYSSYAKTDNYYNLDFFGQDRTAVDQILSVSDFIQSITVPTGISFDELYNTYLPHTVTTKEVSTGNEYIYDFMDYSADIKNYLIDYGLLTTDGIVKDLGTGCVTLPLKLDDRNNFNYLTKYVYIKIRTSEVVTSVKDATMNAYATENSAAITSNMPSFVEATTSSGATVKLGVKVPDDLWEFIDQLKNAGVVEDCDPYYCIIKNTGTYEFELETYILDGSPSNLVNSNNLKAKFKVNVTKSDIKFEPGLNIYSGTYSTPVSNAVSLASENELMLAEENSSTPEYDENGNFIVRVTNYTQELKDSGISIDVEIDNGDKVTYDVGSSILLSTSQSETITHKLGLTIKEGENVKYYEFTYIFNPSGSYVSLKSPTVSITDGTYNKASIETTSLDDGTLNLNIGLSCENNDATIHYIKYYDNADGSLAQEEGTGTSVTLTAEVDEYKAYALEVWSELDGVTTEHQYYFYELNNKFSSYNVTINMESTDGSLKETKKLIVQEVSYISIPEVTGYTVWGDASVVPSGSAEAVSNGEGYEKTWDRYTYQINSDAPSDIVLNVTYKPVIDYLDIEVDDLTPGSTLPTIKSITGTLLNSDTKVDLTDFFNASNVKWSVDSNDIDSNSTVDFDTTYKALLKSSSTNYPYVFDNDGSNIADNNKGYAVASSGDDNILSIYFNKTKSYVSDEELDFTLASIGSVSYSNLTYEEASSFKSLDEYGLPKVISVTYSDGSEDLLDITWDNNFTVVFEPNNTNSQQLIIKGHIDLPSYVSNPSNLDTNVTLTINVEAKKIEKVEVVNKEDVISKIELTQEDKQMLADNASLDIELDASDNVSEEDTVLVNDNLGNYTLAQTLDLTLIKTITYNGYKYSDEVTSTTSPIEVSITISDALINKVEGINRTYKVLRVHNNKVDILDASFNSSNKTITFKTDKFSTYAIVYKDTYDSNNNGGSNQGSLTCEVYMGSLNWTWSETKKACVYRVSNTSIK